MPDTPRTLYVSRRLVNTDEFIAWANQAGFKSILEPEHLHVTLIFSKTELPWSRLTPAKGTLRNFSTVRSVIPLGDKGAVVLRFESPRLQERFKQIVKAGAVSDFPNFKPHVTVTYNGGGLDCSKILPFSGALHFGPEVFRPVDEDWSDNIREHKL